MAVSDAVKRLYGGKITRGPHVYGASGVAFCLEAQVLEKRLNKPRVANGKMFLGKMLHAGVFPRIVHEVYPDGWFQRRKWHYEKVLTYNVPFREPVPGGEKYQFTLEAHCDLVMPNRDLIVEFKTTQSDIPFQRGEFITEAYIMQANAYAAMAGMKHWEIWVLHLDFENLDEIDPVSVIRGDTTMEEFQNFLERVWMVDTAVRNGQDLVGPEAAWECNRCEYVAACPVHAQLRERVLALLPCEARDVPDELQDEFAMMKRKNLVAYDKKTRKWVKNG